ncbi:MAG: shikimate dehydrogenase [Chloroflexi bacterium]|nr:shikimate dehydrogenase [Chloroflexota bacterium]
MQTETFIFVGVSTGQSSIMKIFPQWARILGLKAKLLGCDIPLNAPPANYFHIMKNIRDDPSVRGALVTAHKIDLLGACRDMFDFLDPHARICDEVSCITKVDGLLHGFAKDTISSGVALDHFLPPEHWEGGRRDVLCLGAGGAATAISVCMAERSRIAAHPRRFLLVDIVPGRLDAIRRIHDKLDTAIQFDYYLHSDAVENDIMLSELPAGSLVINTTGMGKDRPGSPITDAARFPQGGLVWELNYRGSRQFMRQAQAQAAERNLTIEDGWNYFLHGWTRAIAEVFEIEVTDGIFEKLAEVAARYHPAHHGQEKI